MRVQEPRRATSRTKCSISVSTWVSRSRSSEDVVSGSRSCARSGAFVRDATSAEPSFFAGPLSQSSREQAQEGDIFRASGELLRAQ